MKERIDWDNLPEDREELISILANANAQILECDKRVQEGNDTEFNRRRRTFFLRLRAKVLLELRPPEEMAKAVAAKAKAVEERAAAMVKRQQALVDRRKIAQQNLAMQRELQDKAAEAKSKLKAANIERSANENREKASAAYRFIKERAPSLLPDFQKVIEDIEAKFRNSTGEDAR